MLSVVDEMRRIVESAKKRLGSPLFFFHGHIKSISSELSNRSITKEYREQKYPCIMLLQDFAEHRLRNKAWDIESRIQLLIVSGSSNEWDEPTRLEKIFKPVLYPIYEAFIKSLENSSTVLSVPFGNLSHEKIDRYRMSSALNEACLSQGIKALFNDHLDGIEIRNLNLKLIENC